MTRYAVAACQTDQPNPLERSQMRANTDRMLGLIDSALAGAAPFIPVRLLVFPEFAHAAPAYVTVEELQKHLAVPIPNEHTDRIATKARQEGLYVQTGSMITATNVGAAVTPRATEEEVKVVSEALQVPADAVTVNGGMPFPSSGIVANSKSVIVGTLTSGPELIMMSRVFQA